MKNESKFKKSLLLLLVFMKINVFTFGGGYSMIPLIEKELTDKRKWVNKDELIDIIAISESTPGPIGICCATFVGYQIAGFMGAIFATIGAIIPSFTIIYIISLLLQKFSDIRFLRYLFFGVRAGVLALLFRAIFIMYKGAPKHIIAYIIMAVSFVLVVFFSCNVLYIIIGSAIIGLCSTLILKKEGKL